MRKTLLLGALVPAAAPLLTVVACGTTESSVLSAFRFALQTNIQAQYNDYNQIPPDQQEDMTKVAAAIKQLSAPALGFEIMDAQPDPAPRRVIVQYKIWIGSDPTAPTESQTGSFTIVVAAKPA